MALARACFHLSGQHQHLHTTGQHAKLPPWTTSIARMTMTRVATTQAATFCQLCPGKNGDPKPWSSDTELLGLTFSMTWITSTAKHTASLTLSALLDKCHASSAATAHHAAVLVPHAGPEVRGGGRQRRLRRDVNPGRLLPRLRPEQRRVDVVGIGALRWDPGPLATMWTTLQLLPRLLARHAQLQDGVCGKADRGALAACCSPALRPRTQTCVPASRIVSCTWATAPQRSNSILLALQG